MDDQDAMDALHLRVRLEDARACLHRQLQEAHDGGHEPGSFCEGVAGVERTVAWLQGLDDEALLRQWRYFWCHHGVSVWLRELAIDGEPRDEAGE